MIRSARLLALAAAALGLPALHVSAQSTTSDADVREIQNYRLTLATLRKVEVVTNELSAWAKTNPEAQAHVRLQAAIDSLSKKDELTEAEQARLEKLEEQRDKAESEEKDADDMDFTQMAAEIQKWKPAADALRKAEITAREYLVFNFALLEAWMYALLRKQGTSTEIPKDVNRENLKFVEQNYALIEAMNKRMEQANEALKGVKMRP